MKISVNAERNFEIEEAYLPIIFVTEEGRYAISMRDFGIEVVKDGKLVWASGEAFDDETIIGCKVDGQCGSCEDCAYNNSKEECMDYRSRRNAKRIIDAKIPNPDTEFVEGHRYESDSECSVNSEIASLRECKCNFWGNTKINIIGGCGNKTAICRGKLYFTDGMACGWDNNKMVYKHSGNCELCYDKEKVAKKTFRKLTFRRE